MGGAIGQLVARDHPDVVSGLVLSGTAQHWQDRRTRRIWRAMGLVGLMLALAPRAVWRWGFKRLGLPNDEQTAWAHSELMRHAPSVSKFGLSAENRPPVRARARHGTSRPAWRMRNAGRGCMGNKMRHHRRRASRW